MFLCLETADYNFLEGLNKLLEKTYPDKKIVVMDRPLHSMSSNNIVRELERIIKELKQV